MCNIAFYYCLQCPLRHDLALFLRDFCRTHTVSNPLQVASGRHRQAGYVRCMVRPNGGACCSGACPPPWCSTLCWCPAPLMVGPAVLVRGPPHGGAWPPSCWGLLCGCLTPTWWGVPWWCVAPYKVGHAVLMCGPPHGMAWPPSRWGVLWRCLAPRLVGRAVLVRGPPLGGACPVAAGPPLWWGLLWLMPGSPHGGVCCVGAGHPPWWGVLSWCV